MRNNEEINAKYEKIAEKDKLLIRHLQLNGRLSDTDAARILKISNDTARRRRERLEEKGIIKIHAHIDPKKLGFTHYLHLALRAKPSIDTRKLAIALSRDGNVYYAALSLGQEQHILIHYRAKSREALYDYIQKIRNNKNVQSISVDVIFDVIKASYHSIDFDDV